MGDQTIYLKSITGLHFFLFKSVWDKQKIDLKGVKIYFYMFVAVYFGDDKQIEAYTVSY